MIEVIKTYDSVNPEHALDGARIFKGFALGYIDGKISTWPAGKLSDPRVIGRITVLANPLGEIFDFEKGNASIDQIKVAVNRRYAAGLQSVIYMNLQTYHIEGAHFKLPGVAGVLVADWAADWAQIIADEATTNTAAWIRRLTIGGCPPVIGVQYKSLPEYDMSAIDAIYWPFANHALLATINDSGQKPSVIEGRFTLGGRKYNIVSA